MIPVEKMNLWEIIMKKIRNTEDLDEEEMRDLMDYLNTLKEELQKLRIILYVEAIGHIVDFNVTLKEPWYFSEVKTIFLEYGEYGSFYLDNFIWRIATDSIEIKPFINKE